MIKSHTQRELLIGLMYGPGKVRQVVCRVDQHYARAGGSVSGSYYTTMNRMVTQGLVGKREDGVFSISEPGIDMLKCELDMMRMAFMTRNRQLAFAMWQEVHGETQPQTDTPAPTG